MVSWGWIPICLIVGALIGIFCMAMVEISREDRPTNQQRKEWWDDE